MWKAAKSDDLKGESGRGRIYQRALGHTWGRPRPGWNLLTWSRGLLPPGRRTGAPHLVLPLMIPAHLGKGSVFVDLHFPVSKREISLPTPHRVAPNNEIRRIKCKAQIIRTPKLSSPHPSLSCLKEDHMAGIRERYSPCCRDVYGQWRR